MILFKFWRALFDFCIFGGWSNRNWRRRMTATTEGLLSRRCSTYSEMFMLQGLSCSYREELQDHWFVVQTCSKCLFWFSKFGSHSVSHRFSFLTFGLVTISHHIPSRPASASQINARCLGDADGSCWAPSKDEGLQGHIETYTGSLCLFIYASVSTWTILTICAMSLSQ